MNYIGFTIISLLVAYIVYFGISRKGFIVGFVLNFIYCSFITYYLQNQPVQITIILIATICLVTAILTFVQYIAYQKTDSFIGYLAYVVFIVVVVVVVVYLTKLLFTFLANPSMLFNK